MNRTKTLVIVIIAILIALTVVSIYLDITNPLLNYSDVCGGHSGGAGSNGIW